MWRNVLVAGSFALLAGCSAGTDAAPSTDVGHGNPEDVVRVLAGQGVECDDFARAEVAGVESAGRCRIDGREVEVVHFERPSEQRTYQEACTRSTTRYCIGTLSWAISSTSSDTVQRASKAMGVSPSVPPPPAR